MVRVCFYHQGHTLMGSLNLDRSFLIANSLHTTQAGNRAVLLQTGNFVVIDAADKIQFQTGIEMKMDPTRCEKESQIAAGVLGMEPCTAGVCNVYVSCTIGLDGMLANTLPFYQTSTATLSLRARRKALRLVRLIRGSPRQQVLVAQRMPPAR